MDFTLSEDLFMAILNLIWIVVTYGYIPHILFTFAVLVSVFYFLILLSFYREIKFILIDKYYFMKGYLYFWSLEKYHFTKSYIRAYYYIMKEWDSSIWIALIIGVVFTFLIVYLVFDYAISQNQLLTEQKP